ncbi:calcineurin-like phosphoesterase family protein [Maribellus sp. YY47]|uniref:calcineurin-like phosphoesterase C-terminal domain-containing protein n=1 Tax=Maribellus sp. YY47 TaxID=2929486 RepID=UPI002001A799|nr:calcineurin-like phosphoesterase family protein [Maribellus sp. YY47]MCK3683514.1 calcineurin-like phosphoesterase family protein [Maribellus sp. YY47]
MKTNLKYNKILLYLVFAVISSLYGCEGGDDNEEPVDDFNIQISLPSTIDITKGGEYVFTAQGGGGLKTSDSFILESGGISYVCPVTAVSSTGFTVQISNECKTGTYNVSVKRDERKKSVGKIYLNIVDFLFTPDEGTTVYGIVKSEEGGLEGVVVSDGVEVTTTNEEGIYQLKSAKKRNYVFISVPANYEAPSSGVLPQFFQTLKASANTVERVDFTLQKVNGQDAYKVFMLGDMHLAARTNDLSQFSAFTSDLNTYMNANASEKMYAIALGDMTWDLYWYSNNFGLPEYLNTINSQVKNLQIFHTIGNHDYDYQATSDFTAELKYMNHIAPTYYSFNIGEVHYVVMDDIDCSEYDGTTSRKYKKLTSAEQLSWLEKDLAYVDKSTPLVVAMHAQVYYPTETAEFKIDHDITSTEQLFNILNGYKVHFVTGHTHMTFNVTPQAAVTGGNDFYEHNAGAVCASWWWSGNLTPGVHISPDGTPGGYSIWDVSGKDLQYVYKATGWPEDYQFRSYDLNNVSFSLADVPLMPSSVSASVKNKYMQYVDAYPANNNNEVLINIWNWNPRWTLTVTDESGKCLTPEEVWAYDPLHIAALSVKRFNSASLTSTPSFITEKFTHFFKVKADDADTDLSITVKDEFGHIWTENMQRPKAFSTDAYKTK